jgi:NTP pyrophosphatase (non-canonical NTP hydrolase)
MSLVDLEPSTRREGGLRRRAVLCGSFRRDPEALHAEFTALRNRFDVLSPASIDFVEPEAEFVRLASELGESEAVIERRHLDAVSEADLVWLHAPNGYVGTSAAMELGHAAAIGVPIYCSTAPSDPVLAALVTIVTEPSDIALNEGDVLGLPGQGIDRLQRYYRTTAARRGWDGESARDTMLLLTEEIGELARAVRKAEQLERHHEYSQADAAEELADVQLYLVHLANALGLSLADAVSAKERRNAERFNDRDAA